METIGAIIGWIVFGAIVGLLARLLVPGRQAMGMIMTIVLGIVGSLVGGLISWMFTGGPDDPYAAASWIMSIVGAVILILIGGTLGRGRTHGA
jgi:uncharacterized membrane protein YeaQ/YmgE (transglycosylase-associated protein family)